MPTLHAYRCTGPEAFGPALPPGATHRRKRGYRLGVTLRDALADRAAAALGQGWPLRIFEVTIAQPDLIPAADADPADTDAGILRASAFSVFREIPLTEAFGPRTPDLTAFLAALPATRWLRPAGAPPARDRIADLIAEHYQALADYQPAPDLPVRLVRDWQTARDLFQHRETYYRTISDCPAGNTVCRIRLQTTQEGAFRIAQVHAHVTAYLGAWDAAWAAYDRGVVASITSDPLFTQQQAGPRAIETATAARAAARGPARAVALGGAVLDVAVQGPVQMPSAHELFADAIAAAQAVVARLHRNQLPRALDADGVPVPSLREQMVTSAILSGTDLGIWLSVMAARHAGFHVAHLLQNAQLRDPWRPLLDLWRLGVWPMGEMDDRTFVVYVPPPQN